MSKESSFIPIGKETITLFLWVLLVHKKKMHLGTWNSPLSCLSGIKPGFISRPAL